MGNLLGLANPMANNFINLDGNNFIGSRQRPDVFREPVAQTVAQTDAQTVALMMLQPLLATNPYPPSQIVPYSEQEQSNPICEEEDNSITSMFTEKQLDKQEYNSTTSDFIVQGRELEGGGKKKKTPVKSSSTRSRTSSN